MCTHGPVHSLSCDWLLIFEWMYLCINISFSLIVAQAQYWVPTGPEAFLGLPGMCGLWSCAQTHLKTALCHTCTLGGAYNKYQLSIEFQIRMDFGWPCCLFVTWLLWLLVKVAWHGYRGSLYHMVKTDSPWASEDCPIGSHLFQQGLVYCLVPEVTFFFNRGMPTRLKAFL